MKPLAIDLFCGLGGWTEGLLAEGYEVVGFDIEQHVYGEHRYPAHLVLQNVLTLHGSQFRDAALIVASPPCQAYSFRAMPWTRARTLPPPDNSLFEACFRIQREACDAAGRHVPLVVENVRGAQKWVGRARWHYGSWHYGSFYLWGDVPALMPFAVKATKMSGRNMSGDPDKRWGSHQLRPGGDEFAALLGGPQAFNSSAERAIKNSGGSWFAIGSPGQKVTGQNPIGAYIASIGVDKNAGTKGFAARLGQSTIAKRYGSKSNARKAASAAIAKIPLPLSRHIAHVYNPTPHGEAPATVTPSVPEATEEGR